MISLEYMFRDLLSLLFPENCLNCRQSLTTAESYLCVKCKADMPLTKDYGRPDNALYQKFAFEPRVKSAAAFLYFNQGGIAQKLLHQLKYRGKKELAKTLGGWFSPNLQQLDVDFILPVPLHPRKKAQRGYNQSEYFAQGLTHDTDIEVRTDLIRRMKATQSQTGKSKSKRWTSMANVFSAAATNLTGQRVLVVDDVVTTGATIGMLCERLVEANVSEIHIASIARGA